MMHKHRLAMLCRKIRLVRCSKITTPFKVVLEFALGVSFLRIAALFQIVDGWQVVGAGMLRGIHDTRVPMIFALFGYWAIGLGVGVALAFFMNWRGVGIWSGLAAGLGIVSVLMIWRWSRRDRLGLLPASA